ncbi:hypothetical protein [Aquimarina latercula]|uniref:hypothetical protein n=1 Tax=Aquimarina latercula TaxID=987 RepID=UPI0003F94729|nr:hypothetical protein [Aquimarina latercula]
MGNRDYKLNIAKNRIASIKESIKSNRPIDSSDKKWLRSQKKLYQNNPKGFDKERIIMLNSLIPLLGYDWRKGRNYFHNLRKENIKEIQELLNHEKPLTPHLLSWLRRNRKQYEEKPERFSNEYIALLDSFIPMGYNWRENKNDIKNKKIQERNVEEIQKLLKQGKPLPAQLLSWLNRQQIQYKENLENYGSERIALLDSLTPLLGYSWKQRYRKREEKSAKMINKISSALKSKRKLPKDAREWLNRQRQLYNAHPETYSQSNKNKLDALNSLLGYDWKIFQKPSVFLPFSERIALIKKELESGNELQSADKSWIASRKKMYLKKPSDITIEQLALLNELNPFLEKPWNTPPERPKPKSKTFLDYIKDIKEQNIPYETLTTRQKGWLQKQRKEYHSNREGFSKEKVKILNTLIPILGRDWKKYVLKNRALRRTFDQIIKEIINKTEVKMPLHQKEKSWLIEKRNAYKKNMISQEHIEKLDELIPLLGYDWKVKQRHDAPHKTFEQYIIDIKKELTTSGKISKKQRNFLTKQRKYYQRNPEQYPLYKIKELDNLSILLQKDWKISKISYPKTLSFEESLAKIRNQLIVGKALNRKQHAWLSRQRLHFKNHDPQLSQERIVSLDSLIVLLGYDWKTYFKER